MPLHASAQFASPSSPLVEWVSVRNPLLGQRRLHYAWVIAIVTFLALLASAGIGATRAVLVLPLEREFGWDRATISLALSINLLLFGLLGTVARAGLGRLGV